MKLDNIIKKVLQEQTESVVSQGLRYHLDNNIPLTENIYRPHSESFFDLINEVRELYFDGEIVLNEEEVELIETSIGEKVRLSNGREVYLDIPLSEEFINEAEYNGKKVEIGKPVNQEEIQVVEKNT
jgi:hypothetical protein